MIFDKVTEPVSWVSHVENGGNNSTYVWQRLLIPRYLLVLFFLNNTSSKCNWAQDVPQPPPPLAARYGSWEARPWDADRSSVRVFLPAGIKRVGCSWCVYLGLGSDFRNGSHTQLSNEAEAQVSESVACCSSPGPLYPEKLTFLSEAFLL